MLAFSTVDTSPCCDRCVFRNHSPSIPSSCPMFFIYLFPPKKKKQNKKTFEYNIVYLKKEEEEEAGAEKRRRRAVESRCYQSFELPRGPWLVKSTTSQVCPSWQPKPTQSLSVPPYTFLFFSFFFFFL